MITDSVTDLLSFVSNIRKDEGFKILMSRGLDTGMHRTNQRGEFGHVTRCRAGCDHDWSSRATLGAGG